MEEFAGDEQYELLLRLEELESLLEDLDEGGGAEIQERMHAAGINTREELASSIRDLHARLDVEE